MYFNKIGTPLLLVAFLTVVLSSTNGSEASEAFKQPKIRPGHDFTVIPQNAEYHPDRLIVRFAPEENTGRQRTIMEKRQLLRNAGDFEITKDFHRVSNTSMVRCSGRESVQEALIRLNATPGVLYAEPDYKIYLNATFPNDTYISNEYADPNNVLWGLNNLGQTGGIADADIDAPEAWDTVTVRRSRSWVAGGVGVDGVAWCWQ